MLNANNEQNIIPKTIDNYRHLKRLTHILDKS